VHARDPAGTELGAEVLTRAVRLGTDDDPVVRRALVRRHHA
jgi:hypothetical protein